MKTGMATVGFVAVLLAAVAWYFWNQREQERLKGPRSATETLTKPGTLADYANALGPCPASAYTGVKVVKVGKRLLGDCDGDGFVDEITDDPPAGKVPWPYKRQWIFVLRPGVKSFSLAGGGAMEATIYNSESPYSPESQKLFEAIRFPAP